MQYFISMINGVSHFLRGKGLIRYIHLSEEKRGI